VNCPVDFYREGKFGVDCLGKCLEVQFSDDCPENVIGEIFRGECPGRKCPWGFSGGKMPGKKLILTHTHAELLTCSSTKIQHVSYVFVEKIIKIVRCWYCVQLIENGLID